MEARGRGSSRNDYAKDRLIIKSDQVRESIELNDKTRGHTHKETHTPVDERN